MRRHDLTGLGDGVRDPLHGVRSGQQRVVVEVRQGGTKMLGVGRVEGLQLGLSARRQADQPDPGIGRVRPTAHQSVGLQCGQLPAHHRRVDAELGGDLAAALLAVAQQDLEHTRVGTAQPAVGHQVPMFDTAHGPHQGADTFEQLLGRRVPLYPRDKGLLS